MFLVFVPAFFAFTACGSAEQYPEAKPATTSVSRPKWTEVAEKIEKTDDVLWIGEASNAGSKDDAKNLAIQNAFAKVSNSFGVAVKSEFNSHEVEKDGEYHYAIGVTSSVTGKQIEVKKYHIKDEYTERSGRNEYNAFVLVSIPKTELARIQIEVDGFGLWAIRSELPETAAEIKKLFPVFNKKGVKLNQKIDFEDSDDIEQLFLSYHKAFLFRIVCDEVKAEEYNGEFYSVVKIKAELFNLMTSETINHWEVESKGAAYSAKEARENAVTKAVREIIDQIQ